MGNVDVSAAADIESVGLNGGRVGVCTDDDFDLLGSDLEMQTGLEMVIQKRILAVSGAYREARTGSPDRVSSSTENGSLVDLAGSQQAIGGQLCQ